MGKLTNRIRTGLIAGVLLGTLPHAFAKPAKKPQKPQPMQPAPTTPVANPLESDILPARYVGADVANHVAALLPTLAIRSRETDPFGQLQDLEAKSAAMASASAARATPREPAVPFSEVVSLIQINTVMAGEKRFLVGSRSFAQGDQFPLNFRGKQMRIQVAEVSSRRVQFKNLETGETAAHDLNLLPAGMTPGQGGVTAPGMVPSGRDAPLEIEPPGTGPADTQPR